MPTITYSALSYDNLAVGETAQQRTKTLIVNAAKTRYNDSLNYDTRAIFQSVYAKLKTAADNTSATCVLTTAEGYFVKNLFQALTCTVDDAINYYKLESLIP